MVWHNGLPLPVVDSPEQENCPPCDAPMPEAPRSCGGHDYKNTTVILPPPPAPAPAPMPPHHSPPQVVKRPITEVDLSDDGGALGDAADDRKESLSSRVVDVDLGDADETKEATAVAALGSRDTGKRSKFTLRRSILERFKRCDIDFTTFAPP